MHKPLAPVSEDFHYSEKLIDAATALLPRGEAVAGLRRVLGEGRRSVRQRFEARSLSGLQAAHALADLTDGIVTELARFSGLSSSGTNSEDEIFCLCATGGYGAGLLAPFSDIDLLFLSEMPPSEALRQKIEYVLYALWDLGLRVGHATRTVQECLEISRHDLVTCTTLLDLRPIHGSKALAERLCHRLRSSLKGETLNDFIKTKISEREERHHRFGDTPYLVEPHIKEGRGGLRDLQALGWMTRAAFTTPDNMEKGANYGLDLPPVCTMPGLLNNREVYRVQKARNFLWATRMHLHYIAGRAEERLTFDVQPVLGAHMGYAHHARQRAGERFMRHYFLVIRTVMRLTHILQPAILLHVRNQNAGKPALVERIPPCKARDYIPDGNAPDYLLLTDGLLGVEDQEIFSTEPRSAFRLLDYARAHQYTLHPTTIQQLIRHEHYTAALRGDKETARHFLNLICDPQTIPEEPGKKRFFWLPLLNETGLLPRFITAWSRIVGLTQFDGYHIHTVDEHTIEAVRILRLIEGGKMAREMALAHHLAQTLRSRTVLYLSVLLHDIGKGDISKGRNGDHSEIGARLALHICQELHLTADETDTVLWLVAHHLILSHTAFTRDIDDPQTILDLADIIQSPERLRLLFLMTIADIHAVSAHTWNAWKATLLEQLYDRISDVIEGGLQTREDDTRVSDTRHYIQRSLQKELSEDSINHFLDLGGPGYWLGFDTPTHIRHARMITAHHARYTGDEAVSCVSVTLNSLPERDISELTILCPDRPGIFALIAGTLALHKASIADARVHTLNNGMALDSFWIQNSHGKAFKEEADITRLKNSLVAVLEGGADLPGMLAGLERSATKRVEGLYIASRVIIDNSASERATIIEINGRDRAALLHDLTSCLALHDAIITSAHITTYGLRAVDVFYIHDINGKKITDQGKITALRKTLMDVLEYPEPTAS